MRIDRGRREAGASFAFVILIILALVAVWFGARVLTRVSDAGDLASQTDTRLAKAATALEQYAATATRLPCPADPTLDTGVEVPASAFACTFDQGTLPWSTIGLRRDDAFDAWGWKISYRVYTGSAGSLTQPNGISMVNCDTVEPAPAGATAGGASGGLCRPTQDTTPDQFLAGKGLTVRDYGVTHGDAAYVLVSHGPSGYGGYTASGAQKPMPAGDELANTRATGPFQRHAWSDPDTGVSSGTHFDDVVFYRSVADVVKNANLVARDWPDVVADIVFDAPTISAALGRPVTGTPATDLGVASLGFGPSTGVTTVSGVSGGAAADLVLVTSGGVDGIGLAGGASNLLNNVDNDRVHVALPSLAQKFGITLDNFGFTKVGGLQFTEQVQLTFRRAGVAIASATDAGCRADGGLASFAMDVPAAFDSVDIVPLATAESSFDPSFFLVSEIKACDSTATCATTLSGGSNNCTASAVASIPASVMTATKGLSATSGPSPSVLSLTVTLSYSNVGTLAASGVMFRDTLPTGMNYVAGSGRWSDAGSTALTDASDGYEAGASAIDYSFDSGTSVVQAIITSVPPGRAGSISFQVDIASGISPSQSIDNVATVSSATQVPTSTSTASYVVTP